MQATVLELLTSLKPKCLTVSELPGHLGLEELGPGAAPNTQTDERFRRSMLSFGKGSGVSE